MMSRSDTQRKTFHIFVFLNVIIYSDIFIVVRSESLDMLNDELHVSILSTSFLQKIPARRASFKK